MDDGIGLAENMLGMPGLVLDVEDVPGEVVIQAEVTRSKATCPSCRRRAQAHDRVEVHLRELHCFGRPTRDPKASLDVSDQRVHQEDLDREADGYRPAHLPTTSAGVEATRQVGQLCRSVSGATEYGEDWDTAWAAVELLSRRRTAILNHHRTGASNGPTEGLNFCAKQVKHAGRGFTNLDHYKLRVLLHAGGVTWPRPIRPPRLTSTRLH